MDELPDEVGRYRNGKRGLIDFFMGKVMDDTNGAANPDLARNLFQGELDT